MSAEPTVSMTRKRFDALLARIDKLERENAALREDRARLDWLEQHSEHTGWLTVRHSSLRAAIDAARKEGQP